MRPEIAAVHPEAGGAPAVRHRIHPGRPLGAFQGGPCETPPTRSTSSAPMGRTASGAGGEVSWHHGE